MILRKILVIFMSTVLLISTLTTTVLAENILNFEDEIYVEVPTYNAATGTYIITAEPSLKIRSGPGTSYSQLGSLKTGSIVTVTAVTNNWGKISYNGQTGYISLDYAQLYSGGGSSADSGKAHTLSSNGLWLIKQYEGYSKYQFWDVSHYSIGYGTTCYNGQYPNGITEAEAAKLLQEKLGSYEAALDKYLYKNGISVTQNQYDSLVSFTYNLGTGVWSDSYRGGEEFALKKILKNGVSKYSTDDIYKAFGEFVHAGGQVISGLVTRRNNEAYLFCSMTNPKFYDVKSSSWYYSSVRFNYNYGFIVGTSSTTYNPHSLLSRAMMATILGKMAGIDTKDYNYASFADVGTGHWYTPYVAWARKKGIVSGVGYNQFAPSVPVSKQDVAVMLYNFAIYKGKTVVATENKYKVYNDYSNISSYAITAVNWATDRGLLNGDEYKYLHPTTSTDRAQAASIISAFAKRHLIL